MLSDLVEGELYRRILSGQYKQGQAIPTELELQKELGVSRITVREAIRKLANQALLVKKQGRGTFVSDSGIFHAVGLLFSHLEEMLARKHCVRTEVISVSTINPSSQVVHHLGMTSPQPVVYLERLRYVDDTPAQLIKSYMPARHVGDIGSIDFGGLPLHHVLEGQCRLRIRDAEESVAAAAVSAKDAKLLKVKPNTPVLLVSRTTHLHDATVIVWETILYRPGVIDYRIKILRKWY